MNPRNGIEHIGNGMGVQGFDVFGGDNGYAFGNLGDRLRITGCRNDVVRLTGVHLQSPDILVLFTDTLGTAADKEEENNKKNECIVRSVVVHMNIVLSEWETWATLIEN
jgi:hypothetical protein